MDEKLIVKNVLKDFTVSFEPKNIVLNPVDEEKKLDELICRADWSDYIFSLGSGLLCGVIDACFAKGFSLTEAQNWGTHKVNSFVVWVAKKEGCRSKDLANCIKFLENKHPYASDSLINDFGGGLNHHLRDFTHHFGFSGLFFSILSQITGKVYGTDVNGNLLIVNLDQELIGNSLPEKLFNGVVQWFFHIASDLAGSSNSTRAGKAGSGLPGLLVSCVKRLSTSKLFGPKNSKLRRELSKTITKLFNGSLISDNGTRIKFDFRTELGIAASQIKRAFTVLLNGIMVRAFYFIKRLSTEFDKCESIDKLEWKNVLPWNNPTINRMMAVSSGIMTTIDLVRVSIFWKSDKSTLHANSIASVNIVGLGTFAFSIGNEIKYAVERKRTIKKILEDNKERNAPIGVKTMLYINEQWLIADARKRIILKSLEVFCKTLAQYLLFRTRF